MKPKEKKPEIIYRIIDNETGDACGSYSRACCDEYDFESPSQARSANVHGIFNDSKRYRIAKYRVTYELIDDNADGIDVKIKDDGGIDGLKLPRWKDVFEWFLNKNK